MHPPSGIWWLSRCSAPWLRGHGGGGGGGEFQFGINVCPREWVMCGLSVNFHVSSSCVLYLKLGLKAMALEVNVCTFC